MNGGARPGAGRKVGYRAPHTLEASAAKQRIVDMVSAKVTPLVNMLMTKALKEKDVMAAKELLDRAYGKPKQEIEGDLRTALVLAFDNAFASLPVKEEARVLEAPKMALDERKERKGIRSQVDTQTPV